ncbi:MAG: hypothetical protein V1709_07655 [Planctomycetota bacterium]
MSPLTFYRKYIKIRKDLREVDLPNRIDPNELRIEKTMFAGDVRLYYWKDKHIQCKTELEAKYLLIWLKHGLTNIEIPTDEKYLAEIMPILEQVEQGVYKYADDKLIGYREDTQKKIIEGVFGMVHEEPEEYEATSKSKGKK